MILRGFLMAGLLPAPLAAMGNGAEAGEGEERALLSEGYRYFVPHGRAISLCTAKFNAGA